MNELKPNGDFRDGVYATEIAHISEDLKRWREEVREVLGDIQEKVGDLPCAVNRLTYINMVEKVNNYFEILNKKTDNLPCVKHDKDIESAKTTLKVVKGIGYVVAGILTLLIPFIIIYIEKKL